MHLGTHHSHSHTRGDRSTGGGSERAHEDNPLRMNYSFALAVLLNVLLVAGEAVGGFLSGSVALLADAGHNLSDVAGLALAWGAHWLRGQEHGKRWTYGLRSFTILAANLNGLLLVVAIVGVGIEAVQRLFSPTEIAEWPVIAIAGVATVLNFATAWLLAGGSQHDLNVRGAYLHMLADAAVSLAVVIGTFAILATRWFWIDPAISLGICIVLAIGTWRLLAESLTMLMNAAPDQIDLGEVKQSLLAEQAVECVEDVHVWSVSTTEILLTARICCPELDATQQDAFLEHVHEHLEHDFGISHATLEIIRRKSKNSDCSLDSAKTRNILT